MSATIALTLMPPTSPQAGMVKIAAKGYLGNQFGAFRSAIEGSKFDGVTKCNFAPLSKVPNILSRLKSNGFEITLDDPLILALQAHLHESQDLSQAAHGRLALIEAKLAERGLALYGFQRTGVEWLAPKTGALLADEMGCIDGDAEVRISRGGKSFVVSLRDLFWSIHPQDKYPTFIQAQCFGDELGFHRVVNVLDKGVQPVVRLTLRSGKRLRLTADHEVRVEGGWKRANELLMPGYLLPGEKVLTAAGLDEVISVESDGAAHVYDVVCADPHRNFVANGIIVHNCGKTVQALAALPDDRGILVVCPAIAKGVWAREAARWRPELTVKVLSGRGSFRWPERNEMVVLNYDILPDSAELDGIPEGATLIADECHALKNWKAKRSAKFAALSEAVRAHHGRTWLLTATPLLNRPSELWSILGAAGIERDVFGSYKQFVSLFHGKKGFFGGMEWGEPDESVPERLSRVSLRRMRVDVLPDLPVKTWATVETAPSREALKACNALALTLSEAGIEIDDIDEALLKEESLFTEVSRLRTLLAASKIPAMVELVETYEEQEEPLVVFSAHRAPIDHLAERPGWGVITGDTKPADRTRIEDAFQAGELKGVGATIQAGGVAITLTRAAHAVFVDRDWTPALNAQAEDRICRIGQTRGCVITSLVLAHNIDRRVTEVTTKKTNLVNATLPTAATPRVLGQGEGVDLAELARLVEAVRAEEALEVETKANQLALKLARAVPRHLPENDEEEWIVASLQKLAALDPDHAYEVNDVGFNRHDGGLGHSLAEQSVTGLSVKQYALAKVVLKKYHRQVGYSPWHDTGEGDD